MDHYISGNEFVPYHGPSSSQEHYGEVWFDTKKNQYRVKKT